jgi:hypothetical protein
MSASDVSRTRRESKQSHQQLSVRLYRSATALHGASASALVSITVNIPTASLFSASDSPTYLAWNDNNPLELETGINSLHRKFRSKPDG